MDLVGLAAVITAITTPIALILIAYLNHRVSKIDHAVNGKAPGAQSMVSQVADIHTKVVPGGTTTPTSNKPA